MAIFCSVAFAPSAQASVILGTANMTSLSSGLIGYWPLNGNTTNWATNTFQDLSGQGLTATSTGMSTTSSPIAGKISGALKFNGSGNINISTLPAFGSALTFSAWVRRDVAGGTAIFNNDQFFLRFRPTGEDPNQALEAFVKLSDNSVEPRASSGVPSTIGQWLYVTATWNGTSLKIYVNGVLKATSARAGSLTGTTVTAQIGAGEQTSMNCCRMNGAVDDVRIYNRALSAQEVALLYAAGQVHLETANTVTLSTGLVAYWPLDGATTNWTKNQTSDLSGQGSTGTLVSMSTSTSPVAGKIGEAMKFDGTNYIDVGNVGAYSTNFSISFWAKQTSTAAAEASVIEKRNAQTAGWSIGITSANVFIWRTFNGGGQFSITANANSYTIANGIWYYVTIVHTSGSASIYVNAVDRTLSHSITDPAVDTTATRLAFLNGGATNFKGTLDDVRIYNRALSPQEVKDLYALGTANIGHSNTVTLSSGLVGYWTFNGPDINWTKNQVLDASGNGNTGTLVSMSTSTSPVAGKIGQALKFDSSSTQYIDAGAGSSLNITAAGTITAWVNPAVVSSDRWIAATGDNAGNLQFGLELGRTSGKLDTIWGTGGGGFDILNSTASLTVGKWQFVAVTRTGSGSSWTANLYINGVLDSTQAGTHAASTYARAIIGSCAQGGCSGQRMNGSLDDVRIYTRALSAQEIQQLYAAGR